MGVFLIDSYINYYLSLSKVISFGTFEKKKFERSNIVFLKIGVNSSNAKSLNALFDNSIPSQIKIVLLYMKYWNVIGLFIWGPIVIFSFFLIVKDWKKNIKFEYFLQLSDNTWINILQPKVKKHYLGKTMLI